MDFRETVKRFTEYCNWEIPAIRKEDVNIAIYAIRELQRYRKIGTLEEVREAVERQRAKEPSPMLGIYGRVYECKECGNELEMDSKYCPFCGQKQDWE